MEELTPRPIRVTTVVAPGQRHILRLVVGATAQCLHVARGAWFGLDDRSGCLVFGLDASSSSEDVLSTLEPAVPSTATIPAPAIPETPRRRTLLGVVGTRRVVEIILTVALMAGGCLLLFGANFSSKMVKSQLAVQDIRFPARGSSQLTPAKFPGLQQYAGQKVDTGPKAKAYANEFIKRHLAAVADGKTYSQVSELSRANPTDAKLAGQASTLSRGETLRSLLLYAWGWSVVSTVALFAGIAALIGFVVMLVVTIGDFLAGPMIAGRQAGY